MVKEYLLGVLPANDIPESVIVSAFLEQKLSGEGFKTIPLRADFSAAHLDMIRGGDALVDGVVISNSREEGADFGIDGETAKYIALAGVAQVPLFVRSELTKSDRATINETGIEPVVFRDDPTIIRERLGGK
jgi:hypothetical protein